jgi:hypothetical protein
VVEVKDTDLNLDSESDPENIENRQIIDADPTVIVATTKFQLEEPVDIEEGERIFHSQMLVKGTPLHFIVDNDSQKNLISTKVVKQLGLSKTPHSQTYNIGWLHQGRDLRISQQCRLFYDIHPFKDEVVCDISPLDVCDVVLGQPYMWKRHDVYESRPHSVIITLGGQLYRIPEVVSTTSPPKQHRKVISHNAKFIIFIVCSKDAQKTATITAASTPSIQQKQIVKEKEDIVSSPTMVPTQCPVKPRDNRLVEHIQPRQQQVCDSLSQTKQHNFSKKARNSPRFIFIKCFPLFPGHSMQWRPLLPKGRGLIQVDIGGHPPVPTGSSYQFLVHHVLLYFFVIVGYTLTRLSKPLHIFQVDTSGLPPNPTGLFCMFSCQHILVYFWVRFGALNNVFFFLLATVKL